MDSKVAKSINFSIFFCHRTQIEKYNQLNGQYDETKAQIESLESAKKNQLDEINSLQRLIGEEKSMRDQCENEKQSIENEFK